MQSTGHLLVVCGNPTPKVGTATPAAKPAGCMQSAVLETTDAGLALACLLTLDCMYLVLTATLNTPRTTHLRMYVFVQCPGDQLGANRQSSVHVNLFIQNTVSRRKPFPNTQS